MPDHRDDSDAGLIADLGSEVFAAQQIVGQVQSEEVLITYISPRVEEDHRRQWFKGHKYNVTWISDDVEELDLELRSLLADIILDGKADNVREVCWNGIRYSLQYQKPE